MSNEQQATDDRPVSVVTGANSGIGRATAIHLAQHGHRVIGTVRSVEKAEKLQNMAATAAVSVGFEVVSSEGDRVVLRHAVDPADITPDSWTLRLIAERHGAVYDGWRCAVIRASGGGRPRRSWRRR